MSGFNKAYFRMIQALTWALCFTSTYAYASNGPQTLGQTMVGVGWLDWFTVFALSTSFGLVSLLQRLKSAEQDSSIRLFVSAHMAGAVISGVGFYLMTQSFDEINRFLQALIIGSAGWGGSKGADWLAAKTMRWSVNKRFDSEVKPGDSKI